jgi:predicted nucleic acid-binding protein
MVDEAVSILRDKYREMQRLRHEAEAGGAGDPKHAMAALAGRFPGALRQVDRLSLPTIDARLDELTAAVDGIDEAVVPRWARLEIAYHGRMRATLRVKSAVRGAVDEDDALKRATAAWAQLPDEPTEPMNAERLAEIREPLGGRLNPSVLTAVARDHGVSREEVHSALFSGDGDGA